MSAQEEDKLDKIYDAIEKMNRGLYGDPDNKIPGLMQGHYELKDEVDKIKEFKKKAVWTFAGLTTAAPFIAAEIRKYFGL